MNALKVSDDDTDVFRDIIKERRDSFFVTYQPADSRYPFALLNLVYPDSVPDRSHIAEHMTQEMANWLKRYPVPLMVSAFNSTDDCLDVCAEPAQSHLMGYVERATSNVRSR